MSKALTNCALEQTTEDAVIAGRLIYLARLLVVLVCCCFIAIPIAHDIFPIFNEIPPHGMAPAKPALSLNKKNLRSGKWQRSLESRAKRNSGLWFPLTLVANEIYSRLFGQISAFNSGSVMLGNNGYLFQSAHLASLNHRRPKNHAKLPSRVKAIKELQERLAEKGKTLLIVVTPNLPSLYPEIVPSIHLDPSRNERPHPYSVVREAFEQEGVLFVDTVEHLKNLGHRYPVKFFSPAGSHWNDLGSCLALQAINHKLMEQGRASFRGFSCDRYNVVSTPRTKDLDLLGIANLLIPTRLHAPVPYVDISYTSPPPSKQPSVLLVGTSYLFALSEHLYDWDLAKNHELYFYFRQARRGGQKRFHALSKASLDWSKIFENDIILVNVGIGNPVTIGYGFIEEALAKLKES